jgi:hypothetical protein
MIDDWKFYIEAYPYDAQFLGKFTFKLIFAFNMEEHALLFRLANG